MNNFYIILDIILFIWTIGLTVYLIKLNSHYQGLMKGHSNGNLTQVLNQITKEVTLDRKNIEQLKESVAGFSEDVISHIQNVGILRFNPFADTGGDQSFILAILDGNDSGIVLTSLHSRGTTRWYAKNVRSGKGVDHELSEDELKAIRKTVGIKYKKTDN
ncbi:hypothetical protein A3D03_01890 [Candidatus Gottesmanbacteria bacterium RIFCSPHIGHO2_02_FULL_40_13]|uniref:DUF4446 domain-containing protein n=1 Tax=Candidatus Gottesmanbacteria bacterium RIFCSPHIGHO2_02_FULL_40_13 TaxID=1798384 RepID=A0A1F6ACF6_9BACT|nr:MAG: hypothetical protein A3D03_01890 [Candidatus Gottesmanbacteria bacterium RIFCSPHIGHO2_02_FULL_40_13]